MKNFLSQSCNINFKYVCYTSESIITYVYYIPTENKAA